MNNQNNATEMDHNEAVKYVALMLADQCARHLEENDELTEEEITEMYYDHLLADIARGTI
jgi:hypothetical protein